MESAEAAQNRPENVTPIADRTPMSDLFSGHRTVVLIIGVVALIGIAIVGYLMTRPAQSKLPGEKVYHVGILDALEYFAPGIDGFKSKMTELGYIEGKNITYDIQHGPKPVGNKSILQTFVSDGDDLILAFPTEASLEAKEVTKGTNIPIISLDAAFEGNDLADSIRHPGANLTGVRFAVPEIASKRFEIMHQIVPKATRVLIPYLKDYPTVAPALAAVRPLASAAGVTLVEIPVTTPDDLQSYLDTQEKNPQFDAILYVPEPISIIPPFATKVQAFADRHNIPLAGVDIQDDDRGPMFSLIANATNVGALAAPLADKIFKGTPPGEIPIVTPESVFEINYKVIQRLGLTVSEGLLSTASRIVH